MQHFKISSKHLIINRLLKKVNHQQQDKSNEHQTRISWFLEFFEHICSSSSSSTNVDNRKETFQSSTFEKKIRSYLQNFGTQSLKQLLNVIENNQQIGPCILAPKSQSPAPTSFSSKRYDQESLMIEDEKSSFDLKLLQWFMCKIRNINFQSQIHNPLRPLPWCSLYNQIHPHQSPLCLNPYHWACLMPRDDNNILQYYDENQSDQHHFASTPCSNYDDVTKTAVNNVHFLPNNVPCSETVSTKSSDDNGVWCKLSYWEKRQTILSDISVKGHSIHIQAHDHSQDGHNNCNNIETISKIFLPSPQFSSSLQKSTNSSSSLNAKHRKEVEKTREKIGLGVTIFRDSDLNVWLYNRSATYSIFVESPALSSYCSDFNKISQTTMNNVVKVLPGHLFKAYDWKMSRKMKAKFNTDLIMPDGSKSTTTKIDFDQFRFSFLKGFGQNYERSEIMLCPCWMEVMLYL